MALLLALGGCEPEPEPEPVTDPRALSTESPFHYPLALWDAEVAGETVLMVHVSAEGAVDSVYILNSSGRPAFDSAAVAGAHRLEFAPGRRGDRAVAMWARLPVRFRPARESGGSE